MTKYLQPKVKGT